MPGVRFTEASVLLVFWVTLGIWRVAFFFMWQCLLLLCHNEKTTAERTAVGHKEHGDRYSCQYFFRGLPDALPSITIVSLPPYPVGNDRDFEEVTLRNNRTAPIDLTGWLRTMRQGGYGPSRLLE